MPSGDNATGLLGASVPGQLWITTGLHTGRVGMRTTKADDPPPVDDVWEMVVEASLVPPSSSAALTGRDGEARPLPLQLDVISYRVRLCALHIDEARQQDTILEDEDPSAHTSSFGRRRLAATASSSRRALSLRTGIVGPIAIPHLVRTGSNRKHVGSSPPFDPNDGSGRARQRQVVPERHT